MGDTIAARSGRERARFRAALTAGALGAAAAASAPRPAIAAGLDIASSYRLRALRYTNLNLREPDNGRSFMSQAAALSVFVRGVQVGGGATETTMDVGLALRAVGVAGSSTALQAPFAQIGAHYPDTRNVPYLDQAYVRLTQPLGRNLAITFGQQPFTLAGGLLLADDGVGMPGITAGGSLPWWGMKGGAFILQPRNSQANPASLMTYGLNLEVPTEGLWQLHYLVEKDQAPHNAAYDVPVLRATRRFYGLRYHLSYGPLVFDGEAALQRGAAEAAGPRGGVSYQGDAQVVKAKWRQAIWKGGEGIARLVFARGSGDSTDSPNVDEAFHPSHGHRYDGLERSGFGEFFGATPYDAFGGFSTATATGLPPRASGVQTVGLGFTPPAWRGFWVDIDYFLFQADRNVGPHRTFGSEWDVRFRYRMRESINFSASVAIFRAGPAISLNHASARRYLFEVSGRF